MKTCQAEVSDGSFCINRAQRGCDFCGLHQPETRPLPDDLIDGPDFRYEEDDTGVDIWSRVARSSHQQQAAAKSLMSIYEEGMHHAVLCAQMQSGKTGAAKHLITLFWKKWANTIPVVLLPMNDNDLLRQAQNEFGHIGVRQENILTLSKMRDDTYLRRLIEAYPSKKILLVIDESHTGTKLNKEGSCTIKRFLAGCGIYLNAIRDNNPNTYVLSISATPNAELAGLLYSECSQRKKTVILAPGEGYYGVRDMLRLDRVKPCWSLSTGIEAHNKLIELILENHLDQQKYFIVRQRKYEDCETFQLLLEQKLEKLELAKDTVATINYTQQSALSDINHLISKKPDQLTIICVCQRLRASKQLCTEHVCGVFETALAVDTTVQGLVGRCCGYNKQDHAVQIYCNVSNVHAYANWIDSGYSTQFIPKCSTVRGGTSGDDLEPSTASYWRKHKPELIDLGADLTRTMIDAADSYLAEHRTLHPSVYSRYRSRIFAMVNSKSSINLVARTSLVANIDDYAPYDGGIMIVHDDSAVKSMQHWNSRKKAYTNDEPVFPCTLKKAYRDGEAEPYQKKGFFIYINLRVGDPYYGKALLCWMEYSNDPLPTEPQATPKPESLYHKSHHKILRLRAPTTKIIDPSATVVSPHPLLRLKSKLVTKPKKKMVLRLKKATA